ncbi:FxsA family protein [Tomitella biformata]|uniref:FxsA family protein n=1 Tax=Tomitella biformata TaxID=630403 RepID=UPI000466F8D7|nr:FxsA family protein [Tomitella biformata]
MFRIAFAIYVLVEVLAIAAVGAAIGAGWAITLLIAGSAAGMLLFAAQTRKVIDGIGKVSRGERSAGGVVADSTLGAAGVGLLLVPGLVTSVLGIIALLPPTRWLLRPLALAAARRRSPMVATLVGERGAAGPLDNGFDEFVRRQSAGGTTPTGDFVVVDGEVIDGDVTDDINPLRPGLPPRPGPAQSR